MQRVVNVDSGNDANRCSPRGCGDESAGWRGREPPKRPRYPVTFAARENFHSKPPASSASSCELERGAMEDFAARPRCGWSGPCRPRALEQPHQQGLQGFERAGRSLGLGSASACAVTQADGQARREPGPCSERPRSHLFSVLAGNNPPKLRLLSVMQVGREVWFRFDWVWGKSRRNRRIAPQTPAAKSFDALDIHSETASGPAGASCMLRRQPRRARLPRRAWRQLARLNANLGTLFRNETNQAVGRDLTQFTRRHQARRPFQPPFTRNVRPNLQPKPYSFTFCPEPSA